MSNFPCPTQIITGLPSLLQCTFTIQKQNETAYAILMQIVPTHGEGCRLQKEGSVMALLKSREVHINSFFTQIWKGKWLYTDKAKLS